MKGEMMMRKKDSFGRMWTKARVFSPVTRGYVEMNIWTDGRKSEGLRCTIWTADGKMALALHRNGTTTRFKPSITYDMFAK